MPNWYIMIKKYQNIRVWRFENGFGMRVKETESSRLCAPSSDSTALSSDFHNIKHMIHVLMSYLQDLIFC